MADRISLVQLDVRRYVLAPIEVDDSRRARGIPRENDCGLVLYGLESHLNAKVRRHAGRQTMGIRLIEHMVLGFVGSLFRPFGVVRNLAVCGKGAVIILLVRVDNPALCVDVGFGGGHPVTGEVRLSIGGTDHWSSRSRRSAASSSAT